MSNFERYAAVYDLIYRAKDYTGESSFVLSQLRKHKPSGNSLLELGCGTGGHAHHFLSKDLDVLAIDRSPAMIEIARKKEPRNSHRFETRDITGLNLGRKFDYIVSLFHVFSYQATDDEVREFFRVLSAHMGKDSVAFFDYWFAPAVQKLGLIKTTKEFSNGPTKIVRTSTPGKIEDNRIAVSVKIEFYEGSQLVDSFVEEHPMRSFDLNEVEKYCTEAGLTVIHNGSWMKAEELPTENDWSAFSVVKRTI